MFGIIADFLASITTILFPVFASYKALRTSDPAQLTPWLIYWVILSLILLVESWTVFIIGWLPFYSWIRLIALSYLVLPQTQGAKLLYNSFVEPFITQHERRIEVFIGDLHEKGSRAGLGYLKQLIDLVRQRFLGLPPTRDGPTPPPTATGYAQSLLSRFAMPSARAPTSSDFLGMLSGAVAVATSSAARTPSGTRSADPAPNTQLFPANVTSNADKQSFLTSQREKLGVLMRALDREQRDLELAYGSAPPPSTHPRTVDRSPEADVERRMRDPSAPQGGHGGDGIAMRKNMSDNSFQNIEREDVEGDDDDSGDDNGGRRGGSAAGRRRREEGATRRTTSGGGWNPAGWFGAGSVGSGPNALESTIGEAAKEVRDAVQGMSSSVDRPRR